MGDWSLSTFLLAVALWFLILFIADALSSLFRRR